MRFRFAGVEYEGRRGETLAAALVRNGVLGGFRSIYLDRPRGVYSAGEEEPNALVQVGAQTMERATLVELEDGLRAEPLAGKGRLGAPVAEARFDASHAHCDLLVVGGGASGTAEAAAGTGRTILVHSGPDCPLASAGDLRVLTRTTVVGLFDGNYAVAVERGRRLWRIRAKRVVLATGAIERPLVFAGNDRPGIMLAGAARRYELGSARVAVFMNNATALGIPRAAVVDARDGRYVVATLGEDRLEGVVLDDGTCLECDILAVSGGWSPAVHLWTQRGGRLRFDEGTAAFVPDGELRGVEVVGKAAGTGLPEVAPLWLVPGDEATSFVDLERDSTVADVRRAVGAGLRSIEHVKRFTTIGTGSEQGKTGGVNAIGVAAELLGVSPAELGTTTFRPPYVPVSFALLGGRNRGELFDPVRVTPLQPWHVGHGAVFENVGQWKRARFYPRRGESMEESVLRECAAARESVAAMDATTLGKIDVQGPDAVEFLNRLYTNAFDSLAVGRCRYSVMCKPDGMVLDDGVVMRVAEERFVCTTTTGNAAPVLAWMEEWLQTEWPGLRVWLTSVTEQWVTVAVVGPDSRDLLAGLTAIPLDRESFPFMAIREGEVAGIPARVCRISFSGELAFEVNVDGRRGLALWEAVMSAGEVTPYGTETMHVLRAEKGYPIIGQETDGTVTPHDLGMEWIVFGTKPDFLGKRSFARSDTSRANRRHLVGLLPVDPDELLPEGAQLVADPKHPVPVPMLGHVTSSYRSAALGRTFALALVESGRERIGQTVHAPLPGRTIAAEVVDAVLYDREGARRDGRPL
jgi:sarcosine oxidase subunit alpha